MLVVWIAYLQVFVSSYRPQERSNASVSALQQMKYSGKHTTIDPITSGRSQPA